MSPNPKGAANPTARGTRAPSGRSVSASATTPRYRVSTRSGTSAGPNAPGEQGTSAGSATTVPASSSASATGSSTSERSAKRSRDEESDEHTVRIQGPDPIQLGREASFPPSARAVSASLQEEGARGGRELSDTESAYSTAQVNSLLRLAEERFRQDMEDALDRSAQRLQQQLEEQRQQHEQQLQELRQHLPPPISEREARTARVLSPTPGDTARTPPPSRLPRRARPSGASQLVFGAEDTPLQAFTRDHLARRPPPPHMDVRPAREVPEAQEDGDGRWRTPADRGDPGRPLRTIKSKDIGIFNPDEGDDVYTWWLGLRNYVEYTGCSEREVFTAFPGCFQGASKHWFTHLRPRPLSLEEFRLRVFKAFARDETQVYEEMEARRFDPASETLDGYLFEKVRLVSELQISRAVSRGTLEFQPDSLEDIVTKSVVADVIASVHSGLPADWALFNDTVRENAADWTDYRTRLLAKEQKTRSALSMLRGHSGPKPRARNPQDTPKKTPEQPAQTTTWTPRATSIATTARRGTSSRAPTEEEQAVRRLDRELGRCFACHTTGHAERDCPRVKGAAQLVRKVLAQLEGENTDGEEVAMLVRRVEIDWAAPLGGQGRATFDASDSDSDEDVARVKVTRAVLISPEEEDNASPAAHRLQAETVEVPGRRHRSVVAHKAAVHLGNDKERFELHVDGGSPLSMITQRALRTIAPDAKITSPEPLKIKGYRGDDFQRPVGVAVLRVFFPTSNGTTAVENSFEFHVVDECTGGWILGVDNMKADGIDALSKRELLVFEKRPDAEVKLLQTDAKQDRVSSPGRLVCAAKVRIEPRTVRVVQVDPILQDSFVNPWWFSHEESPSGFVKVPSCIIGPDTRGVEVVNNSDVAVDLQEGDVLGETEPLDKQIGEVSELLSELRRERQERKSRNHRRVLAALRSWQRRTGARAGPFDLGPSRRVRRLTITHAEADGGDVLPEIEVRRPEDNKQKVTCSGRLTEDQRARLLQVLRSHAVWPTPSRPLGLYEYGPVSLRLRPGLEHWVHNEPPRRTSPAQRDVVDETLREHDALGISEPSQGSFASGVVLVQQRDKIRFCNDYRPLNKVTVDDVYVMPTVDVIFDQFGKARYFSVVDANKGYYQFLLDEESRDLTGFITFRGLRRYRRMPFGLKQAPSWFQRAMDRVLGSARWKFALAYLDDIVIYSGSFREHVEHLDAVLAALERAGLTISPSKCRFAFESVALLGYKVNSLGLMTDSEKTRAVLDFPEPINAKEARRFFAMAAWYRRFIKDFAARAQPINKSFIGINFEWGPEARAAFRDLKSAITSSPVLVRPDFTRPFVLAVDASKQGLGGVLLQAGENGEERPVVFISRQTTEGEQRYAPTHLELAAVWWCVKKLLHYVDGSSVEVRTDHNALRWLWDLKPSELTEPRVQKFKMALAPLEHKVKISYHRGRDNVVADALSRAPAPAPPVEEEVDLEFIAREYERLPEIELHGQASTAVRSISVLRLGQDELDSWAAAYSADPHWRRIWNKAQRRGEADARPAASKASVPTERDETASQASDDASDANPEPRADVASESRQEEDVSTHRDKHRKAEKKDTAVPQRLLRPRRILAVHRGEDDSLFFLKDGLLFVRAADSVKLCVPAAKLGELIHEYHRSIRAAHPSAERTFEMMKDHLFAHDMAQKVAAHVRTCYECQVNKNPRHKPYGELEPIVTPNEVFHTIGLDFVTGLPTTPLGHDSIMVAACKYSRFAMFVPNVTTDTAERVALRFLAHIYPVTGLPKTIISDRDAKFTSTFWDTLMRELGVKLAMSTAFHAQTDGLVERLNAQLETMLRHYVALDQHDWDVKLAALAMAYNGQRQESTGKSPYRLVFNREPSTFPLRTLAAAADPTSSKISDIFAVHADAQAAMELARERQRHAYNARHQPIEFQVGDPVLINLKNYRFDLDPTNQARAKLGPRFAGPFPVKARVGRLAYELEVPSWFRAHPVLPVTALEPFRGDPETVAPRLQAGTLGSDGEAEARVQAFVGRRPTQFEVGKKFDYLIKWWGIAPTWQSDTRLPGLDWARKTFEERARRELNLPRLRGSSTIILPEAKERAASLAAAEDGNLDAARTLGSPLGGEVVTQTTTETP